MTDQPKTIVFRAPAFKVTEESGTEIYEPLSSEELIALLPEEEAARLTTRFSAVGSCNTQIDTWGNKSCYPSPANPCREGGKCKLKGSYPIFYCDCVDE